MRASRAIAWMAGIAIGGMALGDEEAPVFYLGENEGSDGNVILDRVEYASGRVYTKFIFAERVDVQYTGVPGKMKINVGKNVESLFGVLKIDGGDGHISSDDLERFTEATTEAMQNVNLNHYIDTTTGAEFLLTVRLEQPLVDNDVERDQTPEILYFERGTNGGNSTLTIELLDGEGELIATRAVTPHNTYHTEPQAVVVSGQIMSAVAIDLSEFGVMSVSTIRMRKPRVGDPLLGGGSFVSGETRPDFKMAFIQTVDVQMPYATIGD